MNKRTDLLRSIYMTAPEPLPAGNAPKAQPRSSSGSVKMLSESFSTVERENEELRTRLSSGSVIVEVDPALIAPSPVADRFDDMDESSFEALKASIAERGQEVPVLLREYPAGSGRYQSAYGHRRIRAARDLGIAVKAVVRELSDDELVVAQGIENSAREDLSFIERAVFAAKLIETGHARATVQAALAIGNPELSRLLAVTEDVPARLIETIGRAPKVGRGRWLDLAAAIKTQGAEDRIRKATAKSDFLKISSDERFARVLAAAAKKPKTEGQGRSSRRDLKLTDGTMIGFLKDSPRSAKLVVEHSRAPGFTEFLMTKMPELIANYQASLGSKSSPGQ